MQIPETFLARMKEMLGEEYKDFEASLAQNPKRALHFNENKITRTQFEEHLGDKVQRIKNLENGYLWLGDEKVGKLAMHHAGEFYMQEPAAMLPVEAAKLKKGMKVLDVCAAPGGKSTQIANMIGENGLLVSNEYVTSRCQILTSNIERMGIPNAIVLNTDVKTLSSVFDEYFDAVIVDAPCSGEGMFRKEEQAIQDWSIENVKMCCERQREILDYASKTLKVGGTLIYSTCTYSYEENEGLVTAFIRDNSAFSLVETPKEIQEITSPGISNENDSIVSLSCRRSYPHNGIGEGQFLCKMVKNVSSSTKKEKDKKNKVTCEVLKATDLAIFNTFIHENLVEGVILPTPILYKNAISLLNENLITPKDITYARGVRAGTIEKNRFIPEHWFFSSYGKLFKRVLNLEETDARVNAYLRGETISCDLSNGWGVLCVHGIPLGGIKVTDGIAKNHYPKGLRLRT